MRRYLTAGSIIMLLLVATEIASASPIYEGMIDVKGEDTSRVFFDTSRDNVEIFLTLEVINQGTFAYHVVDSANKELALNHQTFISFMSGQNLSEVHAKQVKLGTAGVYYLLIYNEQTQTISVNVVIETTEHGLLLIISLLLFFILVLLVVIKKNFDF